MSLELVCDKCGRALKSDGYLPGSRVRCPRCGGGAQVPAVPRPPHETVDDDIKLAQDSTIQQAPAKPSAPTKHKPTFAHSPPAVTPSNAAAPLNTASLESLAAANTVALGQAPAFWAERPRRGQLLTTRMLWRLGILGGVVGLTVMVMLVAVSLWRARDRAAVADNATITSSPGIDGGTNHSTIATTNQTTLPSPAATTGNQAPSVTNGSQGHPAISSTPILESDTGYRLVGIWERRRADVIEEILELRADGSMWRSVARFNGMSPPEGGRWVVKSDFEQEYVMEVEHAAFGGLGTAKVVLIDSDHAQWTLPGNATRTEYTRRGAIIAATASPTAKPVGPGISQPTTEDDTAVSALPNPQARLVGTWDLTRASRYKSSMISFQADGTLWLLIGKAGASMHMAGTWRVEHEDIDEEALTLKVSLPRANAKTKAASGTLSQPAVGAETKTVHDPGSEITVKFSGLDRLKIDFRFFKVDAGGDYFRRGTEPPVLTNRSADTGDDEGSSEDETSNSIERWRVSQALSLPHTFEKQKLADKKNKRPPQTLNHAGCSYLHVTLEYLRGEVAVDGKDLRLVDSSGRTVGFNCYQERVDKEPKHLLVVFEYLGEFNPGERLYVEDRRSLALVW